MKFAVFGWLLTAAICVTGPALAQEDEDLEQAPPAKDGSLEGSDNQDEALPGVTEEDEKPPAAGLRKKPVWEIGIVGGGGWLPDYPAADQNHFQGIALPYAIYRGDFFRAGDGGGPRGLLVDVPWLELNIGLGASFPVDSSDNDAREGMDDLDYLLEAGPKLIAKILYDDPVNELDLSVASRGVVSLAFDKVEFQGLTVNPALTYRRNDLFGLDLRGIASVQATFGSDRYNEYFYEVGGNDVRSDRERFRADEGYLGTEFSLGLSWGITEQLKLFAGGAVGLWSGSANDDSPLYRDDVTFAIGGGLRWSFLISDRRVWR